MYVRKKLADVDQAPRKAYPSDLSEVEWLLLEPLMPVTKPRGQARIHSYREIINAILYVVKTGCPWEYVPHDLPPWQTVYSYFRDWRDTGHWKEISDALRDADRVASGRDAEPTAGIVDSQSVKTTESGGNRGYDGGKKVAGRKRHLVTDTDGRPIAVLVHEADIQDPDGGKDVLKQMKVEHPFVEWIWADARYSSIVAWAQEHLGIVMEIVEKIKLPGFHVSPRRWVIERTFAWFGKCRRLSKDYECLEESSESWLDIIMMRLFLRRLALKVI